MFNDRSIVAVNAAVVFLLLVANATATCVPSIFIRDEQCIPGHYEFPNGKCANSSNPANCAPVAGGEVVCHGTHYPKWVDGECESIPEPGSHILKCERDDHYVLVGPVMGDYFCDWDINHDPKCYCTIEPVELQGPPVQACDCETYEEV